MSGLLKDLYSPDFYETLVRHLKMTLPLFDEAAFLDRIYSSEFSTMELKERMRHTSVVLHEFFPGDYTNAVNLILMLIEKLKVSKIGEDALAYMFLPDYIEVYGLENYQTSIKALEIITQFVSCEFAVRPFLLKYDDQMMKQMYSWSLHRNHKVRRLATEGCRPRLPWGKAVPALKKDPALILPILENLKNDPSESVRRSVANNLNDIAKDHPDVVLSIVKSWSGDSKFVDAIIRHGSRTLLKQGHSEILIHYGLHAENVTVTNFKILTPQVRIGDSVEFTLIINNENELSQRVRVEYGLYYRKANGQLNKKVFKISEKVYEPKFSLQIQRKQSFKLITTRTFYTGEHQLSIIVNGEEKELLPFVLIS